MYIFNSIKNERNNLKNMKFKYIISFQPGNLRIIKKKLFNQGYGKKN